MLQSISCTIKIWTLLYYNTNTSVSDYNHILFSGVKLSNEVYVYHIEHGHVLIKSEEIYFILLLIKLTNSYICKGLVSIFMAQLRACI